jgi:hypothetical protein
LLVLNDGPEPAREGEHISPAFEKTAYHCPYCGVLATMGWEQWVTYGSERLIWRVMCGNCKKRQVWLNNDAGEKQMVRPLIGGGPRPHVDMPPDVRRDYEEARSIVMLSPRGSTALLRLATEKLVGGLVKEKGSLDDKIGMLVAAGLPDVVAQALDALRVIGNHAVHPGEIVLDDDADTATGLFELLNVIVEDRIARPARINAIFSLLPEGARKNIDERNARRTSPSTST